MSNRLKKPKCPPASKPEMPPTRATPAPSGSRSLLHAPPEIQAAYDEGRKMMEAIKADWDKLRDEAYEKRFNDPAVVEQDEKAHSLLDKVHEWERQFSSPPKANERTLDMTEHKIAGKPRPKGARPFKTFVQWDCRDAAMIRDEALYRGVSVDELQRRFFKKVLGEIRSRKD